MVYVLVTAARNEERHIEQTIQSVLAQTRLPLRWIIVDDASTDRTPEIIARYAASHAWIQKLVMPARRDRSFAAKATSVNTALGRLDGLQYDVVGNLDADITFDTTYFEFLMARFETDPTLGVAGTPFLENGYDSAKNSFEGASHVAGGCQLFRRECLKDVGGYVPNKAGGVDWIAVTTARMKGWTTRSFAEKRFIHHRPLSTAERSPLSAQFAYGEKDYYLGNHPLWELFRIAFRATQRPYVFGGAALCLGYLWSACRRQDRAVSPELMRFHRREQMQKLRIILQSVLRLNRVDRFEVSAASAASGVSRRDTV